MKCHLRDNTLAFLDSFVGVTLLFTNLLKIVVLTNLTCTQSETTIYVQSVLQGGKVITFQNKK